MSSERLLLSIELWQIQDKRHTVLVDAGSCKLIGLSTFSVKDIVDTWGQPMEAMIKRCQDGDVSLPLTKSIVDLLRGAHTGTISVKLEFQSLEAPKHGKKEAEEEKGGGKVLAYLDGP